MRLLDIDTLKFTEFGDRNTPPYVAASHRWLAENEATFQDVRDRCRTESAGYRKIEAFAKYVKERVLWVKWLWIDTCCINKESAAELSEAVNLMFEWYRNAELCIAYLADVRTVSDKSSFHSSEWFKRGWTLQELLAPRTVVFTTREWQIIGSRGAFAYNGSISVGPSLERDIAAITGIPEQVLHDYNTSSSLSVDEKLKWMEGRTTTREEDMSYALYGILGVALGANYGEKHGGARKRLLLATQQQEARQADEFRKIASWLSPPDPWTNHESARQRHEPHTGDWLLHSDQYQAWKTGSTRCLWLEGKAGCGKTVLCSVAIDDMQVYCKNAMINAGHVVFYFSFSDNSKQTFKNLIRSLVVQLAWKEPGLSMLRQAYEKPESSPPGVDELQNILLSCIASFEKVYLQLDALDECPENGGERQYVLEYISEILRRAPNVHVLATSRDVPEIRDCMEEIGAAPLPIIAKTTDADIRRYVSSQMSRDRKLSRLDLTTRTMIEDTLTQKADGMFRWVHCQLYDLKRFKNTKPNVVKAALLSLPKTLDETYERMLTAIDEGDRSDALTLLRWIAYAHRPLELGELVEATIIDPTDETATGAAVEVDNRGGWGDTLEILAGLVMIEGTGQADLDGEYPILAPSNNIGNGAQITASTGHIGRCTKVRLAHFSIKEYLESQRILTSQAEGFHLDPAREHRFLAQSCLAYLIDYSGSQKKTSTQQDLSLFPLLRYAAQFWYRHASLQQHGSTTRECLLLSSEINKRDWLYVHKPDIIRPGSFVDLKNIGSGLYYAAVTGLERVVEELLRTGADVNAHGGRYGNALCAASFRGSSKAVQMLVNAGANMNAQSEVEGSALCIASWFDHEKVVQKLLDAGANMNAQGGLCGNALQAASYSNHERIVQKLLDAGADINAYSEIEGSALYIASCFGHEKVIQRLLDIGANVNARGGRYGHALQAASLSGHARVVQQLIDVGANVNAQGGHYGHALQAASFNGHARVVQQLIDAGANINAQGGSLGNALQAASYNGNEKVVQRLIDVGANVNA